MKKLLVVSLVLAACAGLGTARAAEEPEIKLDGKTFVGQVQPKGKEDWEPDTFKFANGRFDSQACHKYGFGDGAYHAKKDGDTVWFDALTEGENGEIVWKGSVVDDKLRGTMTFNRKKKWYSFFVPSTQEKVFEATLQK